MNSQAFPKSERFSDGVSSEKIIADVRRCADHVLPFIFNYQSSNENRI
jgi:hypothetical protein